jgi:anti-sigma regulatory factor (Ser/Thr protein kinase)
MGVQLTIEPDLSKLENTRELISENLKQLVGEREWNYELILALEEAIVNIIEHGLRGVHSPPSITLNLKKQKDRLVLELIDKGKPFDMTRSSDVDFESHFKAYKSRGLGLFLIQNITDNLKYEFDPTAGNKLIMEKKL